jgi:hypothetical protein
MQLPTIKIADLNKNFNNVDDGHTVEFFYSPDDGKTIRCCDWKACDYYGEFRGNIPWIHEKLEAWAEEQGGYWEWANAEAIDFVPN